MLLVLPVLLALAAAVSSKSIGWTQQLPKDYVLINKDQLSLPIDEYLNLSSAIITTTDPTKNIIVPKIQAIKDARSVQGGNMQSCSLADNSKDSAAFFVCGKNLIKIEKDGNYMVDQKDNAKFITLITPSGLTPALKPESTFCTDYYMGNGKIIINCYDSSVPLATQPNPNFIFSAPESLDTTATPLTIGHCDTGDVKGDSKMIQLTTSQQNKIPVLFYDVSKTSNPTPGTINVPYCSLELTQPLAKSPMTPNNLFTVAGNSTLSKGVLRYITSWSATELLAFVAVDDSVSNKSIYFVPLLISDTGAITLHNKYTISQWNGTDIMGFNPTYLTFFKTAAGQFIATDKANLYSFSFNQDMTLMTPVWNVIVDCGLASNPAYYVSRLEISGGGGDITNPASRTLIVYNNMETKKIKEFAVHINGTKYGCSRATNAADSSVMDLINTVSFNSDSTLLVTNDNKMTKAKINYNTMLSINMTQETADRNVEVSAKLEGWDSPTPQTFTYKNLKDAHDFNTITVGAKVFKSYTNTASYLSIPSFSFKGNNPMITAANNQNVKIRYTSTPAVSLTGLAITDYTIHRIFAVDEDTFVAVVRKPNTPEGFIRFWNKFDGDTNKVDVADSKIVPLADMQIVFKIFKLGNDVFCMIFKSNGGAAKKLTISCYDDKKEAPVRSEANIKEITNIFEVSDIQVLETTSRVDLFMIGTDSGTKESAVLHYYVTMGADGKVVTPEPTYVIKLDITAKALTDYYPTDIMFDVYGDSESTSYLTIKQASKSTLQPIVSKYNISFESQGAAPKLTYIYHMYIPSNDMAFCAIRNEIIFFSPKKRHIIVNKMIRTPAGVTLPQNHLLLPVSDYGLVYLQQFNCIPEKGIFQVLGVNANKKKFLVNFRGGDSTNGARRVHSVVPVADTASFLETAFNSEFIVTVVNSPGDLSIARNFVYTYYDGPKFIVNNNNMKDSYDVAITSVSNGDSRQSQATVKVEIVQPKLKAELKPKDKFVVSEGKTIYLDQVSTIDGPVMDIKLEGTDASKVKLIKRNNKHNGYTGGEPVTADRVFADEDFMVLVWFNQKYKILGDPALTKTNGTAPKEVDTKTVGVREVAMIKYGAEDNQAIVVTKTYEGNMYYYNIHHLQKTKNADNTYNYVSTFTEKVYQTTVDYDSLQVATIGNQHVVIALKMKRSFNSNYVRLVSFERKNANAFGYKATTILTVDSNKEIGGYSLAWSGKNFVNVVAFYKEYDFLILGTWDGLAAKAAFRPSQTQVKMSDTEFASLSMNLIRCWPGVTTGTLECVVDALGVVDYLLTITPEPTMKGELDPISSIVKTADFEMPPMFEIKRLDRGKEHYGFLLQKSSINTAVTPVTRRLLEDSMAQDNFADCSNIIVFFKPTAGRYIYTGITCSEWGKSTNVDFAMEFDTNEYVYLTKTPVPVTPPKRILQAAPDTTSERVGANFLSQIQVTVTAPVDPNQVKFTFVGLGGQNDPTQNPAITLNDFKEGAPPAPPAASSGSSFWTWFIIILVILLIIGGAIYGYIWYTNNQSSSSSSSYTKQVDRDSSKSDLEDTRL